MFFTKRLIIFLFCLGLGITFAMAPPMAKPAQAQMKIGIIDLQRAINKSRKGQAAKNLLTSQLEPMEKDLKSREAELEKLQKELETQGPMLSQEARAEKMRVLNQKFKDFQERYRKFREELQKGESQKMQPLVNAILQTANEIGRSQGYTIVLEGQKAGVVYAPESFDITDEVIKRFDAKK